MTQTYTDRHLADNVVRSMRSQEDGGFVGMEDGWTFFAPKELFDLLSDGAEFQQETKGGPFGTITGAKFNGEWVYRKSDEDLEEERQSFLERRAKEKQQALDQHRDQYQQETDSLPDWLKERIDYFIEEGQENFKLDGWGYELVICHLAQAYYDNGGVEDDTIDALSTKYGTSGNQHDCAKVLARMHKEDKSLAGTVGGLTPILGDPFYRGEK